MTAQAPANQSDWSNRIALAQEILPLITRLHNEHNVVTSVFGRLLVNVTDIDIIKSHRYARLVTDRELPLSSTLPIL
ncbi:MAG: glyceraldehyde-3-phosphate dehydrogenase, partial [Corynebacterium variabile]